MEVIDSESASSGELNIALYIQGLCEAGLEFDEVVKRIYEFREHMHTYFVLETLDALRKNGRLSGLQAFCHGLKHQAGDGRGPRGDYQAGSGQRHQQGAAADVRYRGAGGGDTAGKVAVIAHCNNAARADYVKAELIKRAQFKEIVITETAGVATVYASDGGIMLAI